MTENTEQNILLEEDSSPHEAMFFVLAYLPLLEILTITRICKSLRDAINKDILPWLEINVDRSLSRRLTDDILLNIVSRANGRLRVLALINCSNITDDGLLKATTKNPDIYKLHVPGCTSLTPAGILKTVKSLTSNKNHKLKSLRINGIYGIQKEDLETLKNLIIRSDIQQNKRKILYHNYKKDTDLSIDVDICPKCDEVRMVFDCPQLDCSKKCRGCDLCILRCIECGICIKASDEELEESCCADSLCSFCWLKLPKCNFCNKPYCSQHSDQQHGLPGVSGFVCGSCHSNFIKGDFLKLTL